ncbi:MAG: hypothetical protein ACLQF0_04470 [Dissulfurispiraceae bacterium]
MGSASNIKDVRSYCDVVYDELTDMKTRLTSLINSIDLMQGSQKEIVASHVRHLRDIENTIDWKLEIITKVCPNIWSRLGGDSGSILDMRAEKIGNEFVAEGDFGG